VGAKGIIDAHPDDILAVEVKDDSALRDINNPRDYEAEKRGFPLPGVRDRTRNVDRPGE
jgi:hypothetical protein